MWKKWNQVWFAKKRTDSISFVFGTMPDAVVATLKLVRPSEPEPEDAMDGDYIEDVLEMSSMALTILSALYPNSKVLTRQF